MTGTTNISDRLGIVTLVSTPTATTVAKAVMVNDARYRNIPDAAGLIRGSASVTASMSRRLFTSIWVIGATSLGTELRREDDHSDIGNPDRKAPRRIGTRLFEAAVANDCFRYQLAYR